jgi:hypothetical protein
MSGEPSDFAKKFKSFPYKFDNRKEILSQKETITTEEAKLMTKMLHAPGSADGHLMQNRGFKLADGFKIAYKAMLEAIAENNT